MIETIKSLKKQANMIIYWKFYCSNECVAQEGFQGSEGRFFMELEMYRRYSQMARGIEKAELVFKNGRVFSSGTGEFIDGDVAVADGIVIGVVDVFNRDGYG